MMLAEHGMPPNSRPAMTREERLGGTRDEWIDTYKKAMCDCDETRGVGPSTVCEVAQIRVTIRKPKGCGERWASRWAGRHGKMDRGGWRKKVTKGQWSSHLPSCTRGGRCRLGTLGPRIVQECLFGPFSALGWCFLIAAETWSGV